MAGSLAYTSISRVRLWRKKGIGRESGTKRLTVSSLPPAWAFFYSILRTGEEDSPSRRGGRAVVDDNEEAGIGAHPVPGYKPQEKSP